MTGSLKGLTVETGSNTLRQGIGSTVVPLTAGSATDQFLIDFVNISVEDGWGTFELLAAPQSGSSYITMFVAHVNPSSPAFACGPFQLLPSYNLAIRALDTPDGGNWNVVTDVVWSVTRRSINPRDLG
jgi:hypothetical protein